MSAWERIAAQHGGTVAGLATAGSKLIYAATPVGVFRSTDGGSTWSLPGAAPTVAFASVVAPSPFFEQDQTLFACGADGLYRSTDRGETWQRVLVGSRMLDVAASASGSHQELTVIAASESDGILRSDDGGRTWSGANAGLLDLTAICLALSPCFASDRTAFAGTASGVYRTRNGARSWRSVDTDPDEPAVQCLAISPAFADDRLILAGTEANGLLRSTDGGASWHTPDPLAKGGVTALAFRTPRTVVAATDTGLVMSHDAGETWQSQALGGELALGLTFDGESILVGLHRRGVVRSDDDGATWTHAIDGLTARLDTELAVASDGTLVVSGLEDGIRGSTGVPALPDVPVYSLISSRAALWAASAEGILVSRDGGATWSVSGETAAARIVASGTDAVLAAMADGGLLATYDDGATWRILATPFAGHEMAALSVSAEGTLFVVTVGSADMTLWRSTDRAENWQRWLTQRSAGVSRVALATSPTHRFDGNVFVGLGRRVFRPLRETQETRGGEQRPIWRSADVADDAVSITSLVAAEHTVFAATNAGVFVSRDDGQQFRPWMEGLTSPRMVAVAISPNYAADRLVYGLGLGGSIWRRRDSN